MWVMRDRASYVLLNIIIYVPDMPYQDMRSGGGAPRKRSLPHIFIYLDKACPPYDCNIQLRHTNRLKQPPVGVYLDKACPP